MVGKYRIITLNCNGLRHTTKRRSIFQYIKAKQVDIILLQETHIEESDAPQCEQEWESGNIVYNPGTSNSAGQMLLTKKPVQILESTIHEKGRLQEI